MKQVVLFVKIAVVVFVVAAVLRVSGYDYYHPIPLIGATPGALHRVTDTILLCAIALALVEIHRVLRGGTKDALPEATAEKPKQQDQD